MDAYTVCRLYHQALSEWWTDHELASEQMVPLSECPLESIFETLFQTYSMSTTMLVASDGKVACLSLASDVPPASFKSKRYMKIETKTARASMKNIIRVFYQLMSIDADQDSFTMMDMMGLLQFVLQLVLEQSEVSWNQTACIGLFRKRFVNGPVFLDETTWKKKYREPILKRFFEEDPRTHAVHRDVYQFHETNIEQITGCHQLIQTLHLTMDEFGKRMDQFDERLTRMEDMFIEWVEEVRRGGPSPHDGK